MAIKESALRDHLMNHLDMIESGLQLVDDEFYLANKIGTSGFIDILAKDTEGKLVVIEIKISKHSEREAITELFKYLALLKQNMSIKDSEMKLIVISTDWRELLTPFAEFH
jgi:RecB family endonuclease NucS